MKAIIFIIIVKCFAIVQQQNLYSNRFKIRKRELRFFNGKRIYMCVCD